MQKNHTLYKSAPDPPCKADQGPVLFAVLLEPPGGGEDQTEILIAELPKCGNGGIQQWGVFLRDVEEL